LYGASVGWVEPVSSDFFVEGLTVSTLSLVETAKHICNAAGTVAALTVFTLNLDHVVKMRNDQLFREAYTRAGLITADGFPIVLAARLQGKYTSRVAGSDLIAPICAEAARAGKSIFLFGSSSEVLTGASQRLRDRNPGLVVAGILGPPQGFAPTSDEARRCVEAIANSGADLCFVALGAPKQELFADFAKQFAPNVSFVCIGAGLDFITGAQVRAPRWMQQFGMEWLWRVASNPRRLLHRYVLCIVALPGFLARAALVQQRR
jgi:exopolysaccharide biosynthesis WecB/TagA/CpsF family protein